MDAMELSATALSGKEEVVCYSCQECGTDVLGHLPDVRVHVKDPMQDMSTSFVLLNMLQTKVGASNVWMSSRGHGNIVPFASNNSGVNLPLLLQLNSPCSFK